MVEDGEIEDDFPWRPANIGSSQSSGGNNGHKEEGDESWKWRSPTPTGNGRSTDFKYDFVNSGLSEHEKRLKKKYEDRKIIGFWQQAEYLLFHSKLRRIVFPVLALGLLIFLGSVFLGLLCDLWLGFLILLFWLVLLGFGASKLKFKVAKVPKFHKAVPVILGKRQPGKAQEGQRDPEASEPGVVLDEGWTLFQLGDDILGHVDVSVVPIDVKFVIRNVKTAGGGYCKEVVLSFTLIFIEEAINEFLAEGGKPAEKVGAGGIVDRFDSNFAAAVKNVFEKIPLDEAQAMEEETLQAIIADALNGLFSHPSSGTGEREFIYRPENINPYATIPLYYLGVKLANIRIEDVQPVDNIVSSQLKVITEGYESVYERQDTNTRMYQMLSVVRMLRELGVQPEAIDPFAILTAIWDTEDIKSGARNLVSTKAVLGSSFGKSVSGMGEKVDVSSVLQAFIEMDQHDIEEAMKRMEEKLSRLGYQQKKGGKKGGKK